MKGKSLSKKTSKGKTRKVVPDGAIIRSELYDLIILRNDTSYFHFTGGVTAVLVKDYPDTNKAFITTAAYHDVGGTIMFLFLTFVSITDFFFALGRVWSFFLPVIGLLILFGLFHSNQLRQQKELIEGVIEKCANE
ncbi:MAG: hypothetical protein HRT57_10950 [Crocinitomicaceae bacterium]|nr:hypothetical protein [Crocinitomicaceae bacterium]